MIEVLERLDANPRGGDGDHRVLAQAYEEIIRRSKA